jgi:hypothetical protein
MTAHEQARSTVGARELLAGLECSRPSCPCHLAARQGKGATHCPVPGHGQGHGDRSPSLQVSDGDRAPIWKCHAGCSRDAVAEELRRRGLYGVPERAAAVSPRRKVERPAGVTLDQLAEAKRLDVAFLRSLGLRDVLHDGRPAVAIPYRDRDGQVLFERRRVGLQGDRFRQPAGIKIMPYGLDRVEAARAAGRVTIVEGESDCWACWAAGEPALGLPGKGTWKPEFAAELHGVAEAWIWQEPDAADLVERVVRDLPGARAIRAPSGIKDLAEAHARSLHVPSFLAALRVAADVEPDERGEPGAGGDEGRAKKSQATELVDLTLELGAELWHDPTGEPWMTVEVNGHREHWRVKSAAVRRWLRGLYFDRHQRAPGAQGVQDALGVLEAHAVFQGEQHPVHLRVAELDGRVYLDLCDAAWSAVEVNAGSWQLVNPAPVRFRRARGMLALPVPEPGGEVDELRPFVNVAGDADWRLLIAWLLAAWRAGGPYPALVLRGEQGSAKSTTGRILRDLVDPSVSPLRAEPKEVRDLMIAASNGWCVALDNLSRLPDWLSDALCRLATGGGFSTRELFTDGEEVLFDAMRPALLTGIEDVVTNADLLDRVLTIDLPTIPDERRRPERDLWREFNAARPRILGALLDALAAALAEAANVTLDRMPRMADFAVYSVAVERGLHWPDGSFLDAYTGNRASARATSLEDSLLAPLIRQCVDEGGFTGTASELLAWLNERVDEQIRKRQEWPRQPNKLSGQLRRLMPDLRAAGWAEVELRSRSGRARLIAIRRVGESTVTTVTTVTDELGLGLDGDDQLPGGDDQPGPGDDQSLVDGGPHEYTGDGGDGRDDGIPSRSGHGAAYPTGVLCQRPGCRGLGWTRDTDAGAWRCQACGSPLPTGSEAGA